MNSSTEKELKRIRIQGEIRDLKDQIATVKRKRNNSARMLFSFGSLSILVWLYIGYSIYSANLIRQSEYGAYFPESSGSILGIGEVSLICLTFVILALILVDFIRLTMSFRTTKEIIEDKQLEYNSI